ncbi:MAG: hypothetical protein KC543_17895, partial [Myxococcales bacterium]|nr:hypothetical protein [Myxococcales bacterium]
HGVAGYRVYRDGALWRAVPAGAPGAYVTVRATGLEPETGYRFSVEAFDAAGQVTAAQLATTLRTKARAPIEVAAQDAPLGPGVPPFTEQWGFLTDGPDPVQLDVQPDALTPRRLTHLYGAVRTRGQSGGLSGVRVEVLGAPGVGYTLTDARGRYDLLVNGGGSVVLRFTKPGYLEVQRRVATEWQKSTFAAAVAMTPLDTAATQVHLGTGASTGVQVARGSVEQDGTGPRQATLLFAEGTTATMTLADGTTAALPGDVHVRATELTVGADGPDAMPGIMPEQIAYTYAVKLTIDEAEAAGAKRVDFNQPVAVYLENFIGAPVGVIMPSGWYDRDRAAWIPTDNGAVIAFTAIDTEGRAELDFDGDGTPEDATVLAAFGVTDAERTKVATLYTPGETLWRVPVKHFTPFDFNCSKGDAENDDAPPDPSPDDPTVDDPNCASGSILYCENQTLGEDFELAGTGSYLHYQSDRVPGRVGAFEKRFPVQYLYPGDSSSHYDRLTERDITVDLAGRRYCNLWSATEGIKDGDDEGCTDTLELSETNAWRYAAMRWDGRDSAGRVVNAPIAAQATTCLKYPVPMAAPSTGTVVAGTSAAIGSSTPKRGGEGVAVPAPVRVRAFSVWRAPDDVTFSVEREGGTYTVCRKSRFMVGLWNASQQGLLGLTMSTRVGYDAPNRTLYRGDGSNQKLTVGALDTVVGQQNAPGPVWPDGTLLSDATGQISGVTVGPDGALYLAYTHQYLTPGEVEFAADDGVIYRVDPGTQRLQRVAGGDYTPAFTDVTYDHGSYRAPLYDDSGVSATSTAIPVATALAVSPSGELYFADGPGGVVWKVDASGHLERVAGVQNFVRFDADGGPSHDAYETEDAIGDEGASESTSGDPLTAHFGGIADLAFAKDGVLYIADFNHSRVRFLKYDETADAFRVQTLLKYPTVNKPIRLAIGPDGSMVVRSEYGAPMQIYHPDDAIEPLLKLPFAGTASPNWYKGDGRTTAQYANAGEAWSTDSGIAFDAQGRLLFMWSRRLMREEPGERLFALAGDGGAPNGHATPPGAATTRSLTEHIGRIAPAPDGSIYLLAGRGPTGFTSLGRPVLYRWLPVAAASSGQAGAGTGELRHFVSDPTRGARYEVNARGQETARYDLYSGALIERFEYDGAGKLVRIVDDKGNTTLVTRSDAGQTVTLTAPFGERTTLHDGNGDGYADSIVDPAGGTTALTYDDAPSGEDPPGLLATMSDRLGRGYSFQYDTLGRVRTDSRAVTGGTQTLTLTPPHIVVDPVTVASATGQGTVDFQKLGRHSLYEVAKRSAAGRTTTFRIEQFEGPHESELIASALPLPPATDADAVTRRETVAPDGTAYVRDVTREGEVAYMPDGTLVTTHLGADPLTGTGVTSSTIKLPSGLTLSVTRSPSATAGAPSTDGVPRFESYTETLSGPTGDTVRAWDLATNTWTTTTPAGRVIKTTLGQDGR